MRLSVDGCKQPQGLFTTRRVSLSLLLRRQCLSLRELFQSHRDKHCSRHERGDIGGFTCSRLHKETGFPKLKPGQAAQRRTGCENCHTPHSATKKLHHRLHFLHHLRYRHHLAACKIKTHRFQQQRCH